MRALPQPKAARRPERTLTADEFRSAIELLTAETAPTGSRRDVRYELLENVFVSLVLFGGIAGLLVIWFDTAWGIGLFALAGISLLVLGILPESSFAADLAKFKSSIGDQESIKVVAEGWTNRTSSWEIVELGVQFLLIIGGIIWLVVGLVADDEVRVPALVVILLADFWFYAALAFNTRRELQYYDQVASIRQSFIERADDAGERDDIAVSGAELDVLAKAESNQTRLVVQESANQIPGVLERSHSVSITPEAIGELERLHRHSDTDWIDVQNAIGSLQADPRPAAAVPRTGDATALRLNVGPHSVDYVIDSENQNVSVVSVDKGRSGRAPTNDG